MPAVSETGNESAPGNGFWSKTKALAFFMITVSCKSLADYARGKFLMEMIRDRRARLCDHAGEQITGFGGFWAVCSRRAPRVGNLPPEGKKVIYPSARQWFFQQITHSGVLQDRSVFKIYRQSRLR